MKRLNLTAYLPLETRYKEFEKHVAELPELEIRKFVFDLPLYQPVKFSNGNDVTALLGDWTASLDGYCTECGKDTVFHTMESENSHVLAHDLSPVFLVSLKCQRANHELFIAVNFEGVSFKEEGRFLASWVGQIEKIGQTPSHADICIGELGRFKSVLSGKDRAEFVRAIGLAANGVHIGAFVYLRRLFERLIERARNRAGDTVDEKAFSGARMSEKIGLLCDFLPEFLVANKKIYSVLSKGVHELDEKTCGNYFPIMRESCLLMLEQEKEIKEKAQLEQSLAKAISAIE